MTFWRQLRTPQDTGSGTACSRALAQPAWSPGLESPTSPWQERFAGELLLRARVRPSINKAATHLGLKCKCPSVLVGCELCINLAPYMRRQARVFMCLQAESRGFFSHTDLSTVDQMLHFLFKQILTHNKEDIPGANT